MSLLNCALAEPLRDPTNQGGAVPFVPISWIAGDSHWVRCLALFNVKISDSDARLEGGHQR
jgi:hypothetical protein